MFKFVLTGLNMDPIESPDWEEVEQVLAKLGQRGVGFICLSHYRGSYVQAAESTVRMLVEVREVSDDGSFTHYVVGNFGDDIELTTVDTGEATISLQSNEVLSVSDGLEIFRCFYDKQTAPKTYNRRDITKMFEG